MTVSLDRRRIRRLLIDLSAELERDGVSAEVFVVGGAAIALAYNSRRVTRDVDAIFEPKSKVYDAAARVGERHGVGPDWLNDGAKGYMHGKDAQERSAFESSALKVGVGSARYLLAMKMLASRPEDAQDIKTLCKACGITRADQALKVVEDAYPQPLPAKARFMAEELLSGSDADSSARQPATTAAGQPRCRRCGRPLRSPASIARGMGPECARR